MYDAYVNVIESDRILDALAIELQREFNTSVVQIARCRRKLMARRLHILTVDDDPADREALGEYAEILDWDMSFAANCTEGLSFANATSFDVIVVDQNMPGSSGLDLIRQIRMQTGPNCKTPVLLHSWGMCETIELAARSVSVEKTLQKPMLLSTFKSEVRRLTQTRRGEVHTDCVDCYCGAS